MKAKKKKGKEGADDNHPLKPPLSKESAKHIKVLTDKHKNIQNKESVKNMTADNANVRKPNERAGKGIRP